MIGFLRSRKSGESLSGFSRRGFLQVAALGIGGAALVAAGAAPSWLTRNSGNSNGIINPKRPDFAHQQGEVFTLRKSPLEEVSLDLVELSSIPSNAAASADENFSAIFRGPQDQPLEQDTYIVENTAMGAFPLFIVPIYHDGDGLFYEAIFNRMQA